MPARTNDFQQLVHLVQRALVPEGAVVKESALIPTADGTTTREIDILIETAVGPYRLRIAVEAKDETRKMDITQFESIIGKYSPAGGLVVNKIVVVSHAGFTESVHSRAKLLEIDLIKFAEVVDVDWSRLRPDICLKSKLDLIDVRISTRTGEIALGDAQIHYQLVCSCGQNHGTPWDHARALFWNSVRERRAEFSNVDDEVIQQDRPREVKVHQAPKSPHELSIVGNGTSLGVASFSFTVKLSKPLPAADAFALTAGVSRAPFICKVKFEPEITASPAELLDVAHLVCSCCGKDHGAVRQWATELAIKNGLNKNQKIQDEVRAALKTANGAVVHVNGVLPVPSKFRIRFANAEHQVTKIQFAIHIATAAGKLVHTQFELCKSDGTTSLIDSFDGVVGDTRFRMVLPDGVRSNRIALRVDQTTPLKLNATEKEQLVKRRKSLDRRKQAGG